MPTNIETPTQYSKIVSRTSEGRPHTKHAIPNRQGAESREEVGRKMKKSNIDRRRSREVFPPTLTNHEHQAGQRWQEEWFTSASLLLSFVSPLVATGVGACACAWCGTCQLFISQGGAHVQRITTMTYHNCQRPTPM